ncbi:MAG: ATP-binding protein [Puia sp.]|nr:ATP-binding protein [Puia sp.]
METLIGRQEELARLRKLTSNGGSSFVALYGRRRVGKTFLVRNAFPSFDFQVTGMANVNTATQLSNFQIALNRYDTTSGDRPPAANWLEAFTRLTALLELKESEKKIVFLDELPWLDTAGSGFLSALEHFWNSWASARTDVLLIVCGSAASWIINKLLNSRGGLHNRVTDRIPLYPFTLKECELFFNSRGATFDRYQIVQLYMVMGGIPFYLSQIDPKLSAAQNIDRLCFTESGILRAEFDNLYHSLFQKAERHVQIIEALSKKAKGLSREDLLKASKMPNGGGTTRILRELEESHFIRKYRAFGKKDKNSIYQLTDFYSLFYLQWIRESDPSDQNYWVSQLDTPKQNTWAGYAFEQVCLEHISRIKLGLSIGGMKTETSAWSGKTDTSGAQIDLLIDRADRVINICEMKFSIDPFVISKSYAEDLKRKIRVFKEVTQTRKAVHLILITTWGLVRNNYSDTLVQNELKMDVLFN